MANGKDQWEEETIVRLSRYLSEARSQTYAITGRDVVVDVLSNENFDYQLTSVNGQKLAVEIVRLVESEEGLVSAKIWSQAVGELKQYLCQRHIKGYLVRLPMDLGIRFRDIEAYVARVGSIIEAAIIAHPDTERFTADGVTIHRLPDLDTVGFTTIAEARSINPHGTAGRVLLDKLEKKNRQLAVAGHERLLLVANWAIIVDEPDMVRALAAIPFEAFPNIDTIVFEERAGRFYHVFDRLTYTAILEKNPSSPTDSELLNRYLKHQLAEHRRSAYEFVVARTEREGTAWLTDVGAREHFVMYVVDEAKCSDKQLLWAMRKLKDDPDPPADGTNDPGDTEGQHNRHLAVVRGEDTVGITTVRGHLCRLFIRIICRNNPEYYDEVVDLLEQYLSEPNLYMRTQALDALAELGHRLHCTKREDGTAFLWSPESRSRVKPLAFRALHESEPYPRVLHRVLHVFQGMRMLSEEEATELLTIMVRTKQHYILHDLAPLLMYYAVFRKKNGPFNSAVFQKMLQTQIISGEPILRQSLAWHFWNILHQKSVTVDDVAPYLRLFWDGEYDQGLASSFDLLWEELLGTAPSLAGELFERMLIKQVVFVRQHPEQAREQWITRAAEIMPCLAERPSAMINVIEQLAELWKRDVYLFDLTEVLTSFQHVHPDHRESVRAASLAIYQDIKQLNAQFPTIDKLN